MKVAISVHVLEDDEYVTYQGSTPIGITDGSYEGFKNFVFQTVEVAEEDIEKTIEDIANKSLIGEE
jgi:hypothetical protein